MSTQIFIVESKERNKPVTLSAYKITTEMPLSWLAIEEIERREEVYGLTETTYKCDEFRHNFAQCDQAQVVQAILMLKQ